MFLRFKWFGVCFSAFVTGFMYELVRLSHEHKWATVHPALVAISTAAAFLAVGGTLTNGRNAGFLAFIGMLLGAGAPILFVDQGPLPWHEVVYTFPSGGDYFLACVVVFNLVLVLLMVYARVPKGKMLIVDGRAYYGGEQPVFLPWMKYNVEKFDEVRVQVKLPCADGMSVVCDAVFVPDVEWCRVNYVDKIDVALTTNATTYWLEALLRNHVAPRDTKGMSFGELAHAFASLSPVGLRIVVRPVPFRCSQSSFAVTAKSGGTTVT